MIEGGTVEGMCPAAAPQTPPAAAAVPIQVQVAMQALAMIPTIVTPRGRIVLHGAALERLRSQAAETITLWLIGENTYTETTL